MPDNILPFISSEGVESEIRRIAKESTKDLVLLDHALSRMDEREITFKQIVNVLKNGDLLTRPEWDTEKERGWKCKFRRVTAGVEVTVVAKLVNKQNNTCLVVTVF